LFLQGRNQEALAELERALADARRIGDLDGEGLGLLSLGAAQGATGAASEALASLERALALYREQGDRRQQASALSGVAHIYASQGRMEEACGTWVQAFAIHREVGNRKAEAMTLSSLAELHMLEGVRIKEARILFKEALRIHQTAQDRIGEGVTLVNLAAALHEEGRVAESRECYLQALAIHREVGNRRFEAVTLCSTALLERQAAGDLRLASRLVDEAEQIAHEVQDPYGEGACLCERGHIALARGESAEQLLLRAEAIAVRAEAGPKSELGRLLDRLRRAIGAMGAGARMFRGERPEELPKGFRQWLAESNQLA
jgi:tetratricopeptide (TPR) repeat protein